MNQVMVIKLSESLLSIDLMRGSLHGDPHSDRARDSSESYHDRPDNKNNKFRPHKQGDYMPVVAQFEYGRLDQWQGRQAV